jgi:hypothetical protein
MIEFISSLKIKKGGYAWRKNDTQFKRLVLNAAAAVPKFYLKKK